MESGKEWAIYRGMERDLQETNGSQGNTPAFGWTPDSRSIVSSNRGVPSGQCMRVRVANSIDSTSAISRR